MRRTPTFLIALVACGAFVAGGCSSGDSDASATTVAAEKDADRESGSDTTKAPSTTESDDTSGGGVSGVPEDCKLIGEAFLDNGAATALTEAMGSGADPTDALRKGADALESVKGKVSSGLEQSVATLADTYEQMADAASSIDWDKLKAGDTSQTPEMQKFATAFSAKDSAEAAEQLTTWANENCTP